MNHTPSNYLCPFCDWLAGHETNEKRNSDIVYKDAVLTAFIAPKWWINNPGHVIVISNTHAENIYDIDNETVAAISIACKHIATHMRASYDCTGISIRQHNEPDGGQSVWHFHTHIFPRYPNDRLYQNHDNKRFVDPAERQVYADNLRRALGNSKLSYPHYPASDTLA